MTYLPQGTRIRRKKNHPLSGLVGTIVGRSTEYQPVIGASYIIQPDNPSQVNSNEYPYDFLVSFECEFEVIEELDTLETDMKKQAQKIWDTYVNGYSELLCTPVEQFDDSLDEGIKKILASVL